MLDEVIAPIMPPALCANRKFGTRKCRNEAEPTAAAFPFFSQINFNLLKRFIFSNTFYSLKYFVLYLTFRRKGQVKLLLSMFGERYGKVWMSNSTVVSFIDEVEESSNRLLQLVGLI